jgi:hypothetical protein
MAKNKHNKEVGSNIERSDERIKETQEVFTPQELVESMIADISLEILQDPNSTFIDNSAGSGNFLIGLKNCLCQYHDERHVLDHMLYAVEMMSDNHAELCARLGVATDHPHYVCADALEYHYQFNGTPTKLSLDQFF